MGQRTASVRLSAGHIAFTVDGEVEFYEQGGAVFRAPVANAFDVEGRRHGRWEGSRAWFDRARDRLVGGRS